MENINTSSSTSFVENSLQNIQNVIDNILPANHVSTHEIVSELLKNQRPLVQENRRLYLSDLKRIARNIRTSVFSVNTCCIWHGYITNLQKANKGTYINFYFHQKKVALHRLLFCNYINDVTDDDYIKFLCQNKGYCCNVNCLKKYKYNSTGVCNYNKKTKVLKDNSNKHKIKINNNLFVHFS